MKPKLVVSLVGSECARGKEVEFNAWYNKIHIPTVFKLPGRLWASRYERIPAKTTASLRVSDAAGHERFTSLDYPRFMAIYGTDVAQEAGLEASPAAQAVMKTLIEQEEQIGIIVRWMVAYRPMDIDGPMQDLSQQGRRPEAKPAVLLVGNDCVPGKESLFNEWWRENNLPNIRKLPQVISGARYEKRTPKFEYPRFLTVYEIEPGQNMAAVPESEAVKTVLEQYHAMSVELGIIMKWLVCYRPIGP